MKDIFNSFKQDICFCHQLHFPDKKPTLLSLIRVLLSSRGLLIIAVHRISHAQTTCLRPAGVAKWLINQVVRFTAILGTYLYNVLTKSSILETTVFEPMIYLSEHGHIIIGARSIGAGTIVHDHVTIGMNIVSMGIPEIGRNVWIGHHSVIYGDIKISDDVTILPNTVLTKSLAPGAVVQGNPARIVKYKFESAALRHSSNKDIKLL